MSSKRIISPSEIFNNFRNNFIKTNTLEVNDLKFFNGNSTIKGIYNGSFTMTPNNGSAISTFVEQSQTITGISVGDQIFLNISGTPAAYVSFERAYISSANTLTVVWRNLHHSTAAADNITNADTNVKTFRYTWLDLT